MQSLQKYDGCMIFSVNDIYFKFAIRLVCLMCLVCVKYC